MVELVGIEPLQWIENIQLAENPTWGAPRIHGELMKLGFDLSERTVSRCVQRAPRNPKPAKRWKAFVQNHREAIAAMDFFTVPTLTFRVCGSRILSFPRLGGLHHRYDLAA
jgi:hypothetical protein